MPILLQGLVRAGVEERKVLKIHAIDEFRDRTIPMGPTGRKPVTLCGRLSVATNETEKVTCGTCRSILWRQGRIEIKI